MRSQQEQGGTCSKVHVERYRDLLSTRAGLILMLLARVQKGSGKSRKGGHEDQVNLKQLTESPLFFYICMVLLAFVWLFSGPPCLPSGSSPAPPGRSPERQEEKRLTLAYGTFCGGLARNDQKGISQLLSCRTNLNFIFRQYYNQLLEHVFI